MSNLLSLLISQTKKEYFMYEDEVIVGKLESCDIQLQADDFKCPLDTISRRHFKIAKTRNGFVLTDLLSRNGTRINDSEKKLIANHPYFLHDGDIITLAKRDELKLKVRIRAFNHGKRSPSNEYTVIDGTQRAKSNGPYEPAEPEPIKQAFSFDEKTGRFILHGTPIPITYFTELEHDLLHYLYKNTERLCSYNDITQNVWQGWVSSNNIISSAVGRIRRKLNKQSEDAGKRYIKTKTGFGYMFTLEDTD